MQDAGGKARLHQGKQVRTAREVIRWVKKIAGTHAVTRHDKFVCFFN